MADELENVPQYNIDEHTEEIAKQIVQEDNIDEVRRLTDLFNLNCAKKNAMRVLKLSALQDKVSDQMIERFEKYPNNFSNKDLLDYLSVTQAAVDKARKDLNMVEDAPTTITYQQNNQVNVTLSDELGKESRDKVIAAVQGILSKIKEEEAEVVEDFNSEE